MPVAGDGRYHIRSRRHAEPQRRARGARLPEGLSRNINDLPTLLLMPAADFMIQAFPMSTRGVLAFAWLLG